ncbi:hypothetical protein CF65_02135 [Aggregatibacter actinomycetemcomitans HK1651]|nr:hypothetical protein CF65_02135 [Aggregatibacter actinomycetemcomitans HK1651]
MCKYYFLKPAKPLKSLCLNNLNTLCKTPKRLTAL